MYPSKPNYLSLKSAIYVSINFLLFIIFAMDTEQKYWLPVIPPYDLQSDERYTLYLPARVNQLVQRVTEEGLQKTVNFITNDDRDLESFLFILSFDKPDCKGGNLLAYSRQKQFLNKTAAQLQKIIAPEKNSVIQVQEIFDNLISTALKGDTYRAYCWRFNAQKKIKYQTAYVHLMEISGKKYVMGAAVFVEAVPEHIILPHRVQTVLNRLGPESFESWLNMLDNDCDRELYFFVDTVTQPYRWIAHGGNANFIGITEKEAQRMIFKSYTERDYNITVIWNDLERVARLGGGYSTYAWRARPEDPVKLKLSYLLPFSYKKTKLLVGTGYTPLGIPDKLLISLPEIVQETFKLISEVGLDNAIFAVRKKSSTDRYIFLVEQELPYRILAHFDLGLEGKTSTEATIYVHENEHVIIDYTKLFSGMVDFAKTGGGFYSYEYKNSDNNFMVIFKIAYIKPLNFKGKKYILGSTYVTLDTEQ